MKNKIIYIVTIVLSIVYIVVGNKIASKNLGRLEKTNESYIKAQVVEVISKFEDNINQETNYCEAIFNAKILEGENKDKIVKVSQGIDLMTLSNSSMVEKGSKILIINNGIDENGNNIYSFVEFDRTVALIVLGIIFIALLFIFGRFKGVNTILALVFTVFSIFLVYIPSILSGYNIYIASIITCLYIIFSTLIIVYGINKKSLATSIGCISGMILSALLVLLMTWILKITGIVNEESTFLLYLDLPVKINLKAIVFGSILIGAIGAIMDVSIDIASSLFEVSSKLEHPTFSEIFKSGMNIGRDIMGTMTNTLILAYIGSSMSTVLLLMAYNNSFINMLNKEMISIEILQGLIGSLGLLFTIPFTSIVCSILYSKSKKEDVINEMRKKLEKN